MFKINLSRQATKRLKKLPDKHAKQIATKITELKTNPYPQDSIKLKGYSYHRVDIGEYRIIYHVEEQTLEILLNRLVYQIFPEEQAVRIKKMRSH